MNQTEHSTNNCFDQDGDTLSSSSSSSQIDVLKRFGFQSETIRFSLQSVLDSNSKPSPGSPLCDLNSILPSVTLPSAIQIWSQAQVLPSAIWIQFYLMWQRDGRLWWFKERRWKMHDGNLGTFFTSAKYELHSEQRNLCNWNSISVPEITWHRARGTASIMVVVIWLFVSVVVLDTIGRVGA
jgi:hypothetical protein